MINNLNIKPIVIGGEVERKLGSILPFLLVLSLTISILPLIFILVINDMNKFILSFFYLWIIWFFISMMSTKYETPSNIITLLKFFPLLMPMFFLSRIAAFFLKRKYPNSDDEKDIANFYRIKKIKSIL